MARANAERLGLADRVRFADRTLRPAPDGDPVDLVLANLPYVSEAEWEGLAPEIREYEPREALVAGPTGLEAIEALLGRSASRRRRPARSALEVGAGQAAAVAELLGARRASSGRVRPDLAGIERVVVGRR